MLETSKNKRNRGTAMKVLVIEDEKLVAESIRAILEHKSSEV